MVQGSLKAWGGTVDTAQCSRPEASLARRWACGYPPSLGGQQCHCWHTAQNVPAPCSELLGTEPGPPFLLQEIGGGQDLALTGARSLCFTWGDLHPQAPAHFHYSADLKSLKAVAYRGTKWVSFAHILGIPVGLASGHRPPLRSALIPT